MRNRLMKTNGCLGRFPFPQARRATASKASWASPGLTCANEIRSIRDDAGDPHCRTGRHHAYIISGKGPNFKSFRLSSCNLGGPDNLGAESEDLGPDLLGEGGEVVVPLLGKESEGEFAGFAA